MLTRLQSEQREYEILSKFAAKAAESRGRAEAEIQCDFRTVFQRDRDRVVHSKALRRLMHKTQVFIAPEGDHFRTRLTHTLEVAQIARSIARGLTLNEDLTEAIAMGHDLGHTPFGHNGEFFLNKRHPQGFRHNVQSLRVVDVLEPHAQAAHSGGRRGMNLTDEVRDGILNHTGSVKPYTLEGQVVKISDRIAYINHDIDDAIRGGIISEADLPQDSVAVLGISTKQRIDTLVRDMITASDKKMVIDDEPVIVQSPEREKAMLDLRTYMFENVYSNSLVKKEEDLEQIERIIGGLYDHYLNHPEQLPSEYQKMIDTWGIEEMVKDQIAGMTDNYAIETFKRI
jgi:dGTPase